MPAPRMCSARRGAWRQHGPLSAAPRAFGAPALPQPFSREPVPRTAAAPAAGMARVTRTRPGRTTAAAPPAGQRGSGTGTGGRGPYGSAPGRDHARLPGALAGG